MQPSPRRNICFVAGTLNQGGAERQLYYMLRTLRERGHTLSVLSLTSGEYLGTPHQGAGRTGCVGRTA